MNDVFSKLQNEIDSLLEEINSYDIIEIKSLDDLRSGVIISKLISISHRKPDLLTISPGSTRENYKARWSLILKYMELTFPCSFLDFTPGEIVEDLGVLIVVCKHILKYLKNPKKNPMASMSMIRNSVLSVSYQNLPSQTRILTEDFVDDDQKAHIHKWLQELKIVPPGVFCHEFLYRIRSGVSLFELLKILDDGYRKIKDFDFDPETMADCVRNINKVLRVLRANQNMNRRFLFASGFLYEGNQDVIYGLVNDMKMCYTNQSVYENFQGQTPTNKLLNLSLKSCFDPRKTISVLMKNNIIEWISSLGLLHLIYVSEDIKKNTVKNAVLHCKVIEKLFKYCAEYVKSPRTESHCLGNMNSVLGFLTQKAVFKNSLPRSVTISTEEFGWGVLWEIMNTCHEFKDTCEISSFKEVEVKILRWLKNIGLIENYVTSIFELVPYCQNGILLCRLASALTKNKDFEFYDSPSTDNESILNLKFLSKLLQQDDKMNPRNLRKEFEIFRGELAVILGLLEDMYEYGKNLAREKHVKGFCKLKKEENWIQPGGIEKNMQKTYTIEAWVQALGIRNSELKGQLLKDYKNGVKICQIVEKVLGVKLIGTNYYPKTNADALVNVRKGLDALYERYDFPMKYKYYDDLIVQGDGKTIRSLIAEIQKQKMMSEKRIEEEV